MRGQEIFLERSGLNRGSNAILAFLVVLAVAGLGLAFFRAFDGWFTGSTLVSQAIVMGAGQALVSAMILRRSAYKARWGERAFSISFRWLAIPGLALILTGLPHFARIEGDRVLPKEAVAIPVLYLLLTGVVLWFRSVRVFGIDNLSLMYVYFPAKSRLVEASIYSVLRHPVYSAVLRLALAFVLWNGSAFALFAGLMGLLTMTFWVRLVEERELLERFGESYHRYRVNTPAFFNPDPRTWPKLWSFLATGR